MRLEQRREQAHGDGRLAGRRLVAGDEETLLTCQFKPPVGYCLEFPAAIIEGGESVEECALRFREEHGDICNACRAPSELLIVRLLGSSRSNAARTAGDLDARVRGRGLDRVPQPTMLASVIAVSPMVAQADTSLDFALPSYDTKMSGFGDGNEAYVKKGAIAKEGILEDKMMTDPGSDEKEKQRAAMQVRSSHGNGKERKRGRNAPVNTNDPFFKNKTDCMTFARSKVSLDLDCKLGPFQQINQITHWLDGSNIYGSSEKVSEELRRRQGGLLKTQTAPDGGELLPMGESLECINPDNCFLSMADTSSGLT